MRRLKILCLGIGLMGSALASAATHETLVEPGIPENWKASGSGALSARLKVSSQKVQGGQPLEVSYSFKAGENDFLFLERSFPIPGRPKKAKGMIYGDGSGNSLRLNFTDASGEFYQAVVAKLSWEGWKEVETDLVFAVHWGGDNNGQMDGDLAFHSWVLNGEPDQTKSQGSIALGRLRLVSETAEPVAAEGAPMGRSVRVTIDDFERANPLAVYQTWRGDDSSIEALSSTEFKKEGNYAMQITYRLSTQRSVPSWVSASFMPERPMDWTAVEEVKFWVKGDGTRNLLYLTLTDERRRNWTVKLQNILKNVDWRQVAIPLRDFQDPSGNERIVPGKVLKAEFSVVGEEAQLSFGRFWIDQLEVIGKDLDPLSVAPRPTVAPEVIEKTKIGFGDFMHLEYRQTPELNDQFLFYNSLYVRGTSKKLSVAADLVAQQIEAGASIGFRSPLEQASGAKPSPTEVTEKRPPIELAYINASFQDLHPYLSQISAGNLSVDYGRDVFSPVFGFKGISAEGSIQPFHYDAFALKHAFDSATFGYRLQYNPYDTLLKFMVVHHRDTAKSIANAVTQSDGTLTVPSNRNLTTEPIGNDTVYFLDANRNFFENRINVQVNYGLDFFERQAVKDVTDPFNPLFKQALETPVSLYGRLWEVKGKILPGFFNKGFSFIASVRDLSAEFKPRFRYSPAFYDDFFADQRGMKFELTQIIGHFKFNGTYDDVVRGPENSGYFRRYFQGSVGYYGWNRWDIVYSYNRRREFYALGENHQRSTFYINPADPRDEEAEVNELFLGNWFTPSFYIWGKFWFDNVKLFRSGRNLRADSFQMQGEYAVTTNSKVILSFIQRRFNDRTDEPFGGDPPTDNALRLFLDINF